MCLKNGFDPARVYQLVYTAKDPFVLGVGLAALRDVVSFFRRESKDDTGAANPLAGRIGNVIGFGVSQPARLMRDFINLGFNEDESGKSVWDGAFLDASAAAELRSRYHGKLVGVLRARGANQTEAEDLVADLWTDCFAPRGNHASC